MNAIWLGILLIAVITAAFTGRMDEITSASFDAAKASVTLAIGLIGTMALWLGLVRVARDGGLARQIARTMRPVMHWLFPDVPTEHPAMSAMIMNFAANFLGLANAATPLGIKAMIELNKLNKKPGTATDAMALFLAINTSHLALLPTGVMAVRASLGSSNPGAIIVTTWFATACSTVVAIVLAKTLAKLPFFARSRPGAQLDGDATTTDDATTAEAPDTSEAEAEIDGQVEQAAPSPMLFGIVERRRAVTIVLATATIVSFGYWLVTQSIEAIGACAPGAGHSMCALVALLQNVGLMAIPALMIAFLLYGVGRGVRVYQSFVEGAKEGFQVAIIIIPYLVAILVAVGMLRGSGALDAIIGVLRLVVEPLGMPAEVLPMALIRPLSGSGALGVMTETMRAHGPDSLIGYIVSTINGSTETTFYVLAVYFGAVRVTRIRHALPAGLCADITGVIAAVFICRVVFG